jgi:catechol 2,3-dioxygenase-like lactoylglutathione lyase family enzyme
MRLGDVVQIAVGVPDVSTSSDFYQKLGFQIFARGEEPWPWVQLYDGQNLVLLNQDGHQYVGLNYFSSAVVERIEELESMGVRFLAKTELGGEIAQAVFQDADGCMVGLINHDAPQLPDESGTPLTRCGTFGEFSIPVRKLDQSAAFWSRIGFERLHVSEEPYPWSIVSDGLMVLGLHQTSSYGNGNGSQMTFDTPTLTYFAPDMGDRIAEFRAEGFRFTVELANESGRVVTAILETPGGEPLFLVQGEVL